MTLPKRRKVPLLQRVRFEVSEVAEAAGIVFLRGDRKGEVNVQRARRWLQRKRAVTKDGNRWYVTRRGILRVFGEDAPDVLAALVEY